MDVFLGVVVQGDTLVFVSQYLFQLTDSPIIITYDAKLTQNNNASAVVYNYAHLTYFSAPHNVSVYNFYHTLQSTNLFFSQYNNAKNDRTGNATASSNITIADPVVHFNLNSTSLFTNPPNNYVSISDTIWYAFDCHLY